MKALLQPTNFTLGPDATQAIGFSAQDKEFKSNMRRPSWISDQNDFSLLIRTLLVCKWAQFFSASWPFGSGENVKFCF